MTEAEFNRMEKQRNRELNALVQKLRQASREGHNSRAVRELLNEHTRTSAAASASSRRDRKLTSGRDTPQSFASSGTSTPTPSSSSSSSSTPASLLAPLVYTTSAGIPFLNPSVSSAAVEQIVAVLLSPSLIAADIA